MSDTKTPKARVKKNILNKNVDDLVISETVFDPDKPSKKTTTKKTAVVESALKNKTTSKDFSKIISEIKATKSKKQVEDKETKTDSVVAVVEDSAPKAKRGPKPKRVEQVEMPLDAMVEEKPVILEEPTKPKKTRAARKPKVETLAPVVEDKKEEKEDLKPETLEIAKFAETIKQ